MLGHYGVYFLWNSLLVETFICAVARFCVTCGFFIHIVTKHKAKQSKANQKARRNEAKRRAEEETSVILFQCFNLNYPFRSFAHVLELKREEEEAETQTANARTNLKLTSSSTKEIRIRIHTQTHKYIEKSRKSIKYTNTHTHRRKENIYKILLSATISKCARRARVWEWVLRATLACVRPF